MTILRTLTFSKLFHKLLFQANLQWHQDFITIEIFQELYSILVASFYLCPLRYVSHLRFKSWKEQQLSTVVPFILLAQDFKLCVSKQDRYSHCFVPKYQVSGSCWLHQALAGGAVPDSQAVVFCLSAHLPLVPAVTTQKSRRKMDNDLTSGFHSSRENVYMVLISRNMQWKVFFLKLLIKC